VNISDDLKSLIFDTFSPIEFLRAPLGIREMAWRCYVKA
jgi:hypothetical protein